MSPDAQGAGRGTASLLVGTAGHVDHGKTRLLEALTGIDCDRWAEEKERGITIDLGFAHLALGDVTIGFVDVPGHERFLHNALAGLGGVRIVMLVVAADEGVKPQTREHLEIAELLAIPAVLVALTKTDLVGEELVAMARLEVEELLAATRFAGAPIVPVSSVTGRGLDELRAALAALAARHPATLDLERPARLPLDRAFHLKGLGTVVTGTLVEGAIAAGDELELLPGGERARVRSVQVHGEPRERAAAGERTALQIAGIDLPRLERGAQLAAPGAFRAGSSLLVRFRLSRAAARPLRGSTPLRLHLYSGEVVGRIRPLSGPIEPGGEGPAELRLDRPVVAARGDRFVARRPSPAETLGGGTVLDPAWRRRRGAALERAVAGLSGSEDDALLLWAEEAGEAGLGADTVACRLGTDPAAAAERLDRLSSAQKLLAAPAGQGHGPRWLMTAAYRRVAERAARVLDEHFRRDRMARDMSRAEAVKRFFPVRAGELADVYLRWLAAQKIVAVDGDRITLPGRRAELTESESATAREVSARFDAAGLAPPSPGALAAELGAKPQILDGVVRYLVERGRITRLPGGLLISSAALAALAEALVATGWERFTVPQFKERFGLSRKWAIPLLEHLDSAGITQRVGNERLVRRMR